MSEYRGQRSDPATASSLNVAWLRLTGKDSWLPASATIYSCEFTNLAEQVDDEAGHYHVTYSYTVRGERYTGRFVDFGRQDESYFRRDDLFEVRYDPRNSSRSYYPGLRTQTSFRLICMGIGAAIGLMVALYGIFQHKLH